MCTAYCLPQSCRAFDDAPKQDALLASELAQLRDDLAQTDEHLAQFRADMARFEETSAQPPVKQLASEELDPTSEAGADAVRDENLGSTEHLPGPDTPEPDMPDLEFIQLCARQPALDTRGPTQRPSAADPVQSAAPAAQERRRSRRVVHLEVVVRGVFKLDTVEQTFGVHLGVFMQWPCDDSETPPDPMEDDGDWVPRWTPKYAITAVMREHYRELMFFTIVDHDGSKWVRMEANHMIDVYEELELQSFPTDLQDLTIELRSKNNIDRVLWAPPPGQDIFACFESDEFCLQDFELVQESPFTCALSLQEKMQSCDDSSGSIISVASVTLKTARKARFYVLNSNLFVFLTCTFSLLAWSIHPADVASRFDTDFMIVLTMVSLFMGKTMMVPPLSYITSLDVYMMLNFACVMAITVSHATLPCVLTWRADNSPLTMPVNGTYDDEQRLINADMFSFWIFLLVMCLYNSAYVFHVRASSRRERRAYIEAARIQQLEDLTGYREKLASVGL